ncbi:hypothetical protein ABVT39_016837 [Epinephelus coioides]
MTDRLRKRVSPVNITNGKKTDSPNPERSNLTNVIWDTDRSLDSPIKCFGFPNIGQTCYMNASLQSLLTLEDFIGDISRMEQVWSSVPEAQLMRSLMDVRDVHSSIDAQVKISLLKSFKDVVSAQAPAFWDTLQKDAHEFLTTVLEQMRGLAPLLQETAAFMGTHYTCPVEDHLVITIENTRTCKSCGAQSVRQEESTNLSLDLLTGGSVEEMLQEYLKETEVEFRCDCGRNKSSCRSSFLTPHTLKRFRYSPFFELEKAYDPVRLTRDLLVSSTQDGGCYSLVSAISHFGSTEMRHYISQGIHPDNNPDEPGYHWLTYNDSMVFKTSGKLVCEQRKRRAYILFYKRITLGFLKYLVDITSDSHFCSLPSSEPPPPLLQHISHVHLFRSICLCMHVYRHFQKSNYIHEWRSAEGT